MSSNTDYLSQQFGRVFERLDDMQDDLRRLDEAIRGNGKPGLNQKVATLERDRAIVAGGLALLLPMLWDWARHKLGIG